MSQAKIILVAGPTASGKSTLAEELAQKRNGVIINADAMQVYEGLPILSAQPKKDLKTKLPHRLYGERGPAVKFSVALWLNEAKKAVEETIQMGLTPILAGGTGLYFKAYFEGIATIPIIPESVRLETQSKYEDWGEKDFRDALRKLDPISADKITVNDRQRLIRAYEVAFYTGKSLDHFYNIAKPTPSTMDQYEAHLLSPPREKLYQSCNNRFLEMIGEGAVEEVEAFLKRGLDPQLPSMKTIGVREIGDHLIGKTSLLEAITAAQQMTRNFAKRQVTWFKNQWPFPHAL